MKQSNLAFAGARLAEAIDTIRAPSADEINALPKSVRDYIHDLNVGYDPRGDVRRQVIELHIARESATALAWENLRCIGSKRWRMENS